ncbi:HEAT repeat domain-containing protein [Amycolatopsis sp. Hca4]|uniref:HEAT repeat domain-containing protein n=1 Tax=Amycolatopsis sp. Hca4 TaxID=2742131 RepID=UPI001590D696|nr:HEAT repeat domain-containing protein [Amycolatopsis sp. Hca4]QKV72666.1 HEAT repeat domain-containing protein [Amycolatopsis sp. Hca4]
MKGTSRDPAAVLREDRLDKAIEEAGPGLFDLLAAAVGDPDTEVRETAAYGLGELDDPRAVPLLIDLVEHDPAESVVVHALKALESYRDPRIHRTLLREADRARHTRSPRWYAAKELRWYDSEDSVEALIRLLASEDALVQQAAEESLSTLRPAERARWQRLLGQD